MAGERRPSLSNITKRFQATSLQPSNPQKRKAVNNFNNLIERGLPSNTKPPPKRIRPIRSNPYHLKLERQKRERRKKYRNEAEKLAKEMEGMFKKPSPK